MPQKTVAVDPPEALAIRNRLFAALGKAFDVRFEAIELRASGHADGLLVLPGRSKRHSPLGVEAGVQLVALEAEELHGSDEDGTVWLGECAQLDPRLRGRALVDRYAADAPSVSGGEHAEVLAACHGRPLWTRQETRTARTDLACLCPAELGEEESLRNRLRSGRFIALLPMIDFLRELTKESAYIPPPLRAAFIFDDPNLHFPTYGHLDYRHLALAAEADGYHVAMATIPLDGWFVHRRAAQIFTEHRAALSLLCHGNDHLHHELARPRREDETRDMLAQAMRRIRALEHRSGVVVDRVMVAPHERCSEVSARWLRRVGFEALCNSRPYPWRASPASGRSLAGWEPAELIAGGLPVLPRYHLAHPRDDLVFRAYLDQPLVLFGHHEDVGNGFDGLAQAAEDINRLGSVRWQSLAEIARGNFAMRQDAETLTIHMYSREIDLTIPAGISSLCIETPEIHGDSEWTAVVSERDSATLTRTDRGWRSDPVHVRAPGRQRLSLRGRERLDPTTAPPPRWRPQPLMRRGLTEARDRIAPRLRASRTPPVAPRAGVVDMGLAPGK